MITVELKRGREKSVGKRHPWIFSGAIHSVEGTPQSGETVRVVDSKGAQIGLGAFSPASQIRVRLWTFGAGGEIDERFFAERIQRAATSRQSRPGEAIRLVNGEADELPGLVVDRYADYLVCQFLTAGAEQNKAAIVEALSSLVPSSGIFERSDAEARQKEGLKKSVGSLHGSEPPELVEIRENECRYLVDIRNGHKTGFYLDQSENRRLLSEYSDGSEVLNAFSYTGAFCVQALKARARHVTNIEASAGALEILEKNIKLNGLDENQRTNINGDAFEVLRDLVQKDKKFDLIVLDPPKFADSKAHLAKAARGYKDINLLAMKLLRPNGLLFTFSCSGIVRPDDFQKYVAFAGIDADRHVQVLRWLSQASDHPVAVSFPEGRYLKGLVCRVW